MTWEDEELSQRLPALCAAGEHQKLEFKQQLPIQVRDLAKEVAAFATSGGGLILLGVRDDGAVIGIPEGDKVPARDGISQRIAGICAVIDPPVRPKLRWAVMDGRVVLGIDVPAGGQPLYYVDHRPYIRHESISRPAKPSEVYEAVKAHSPEPVDDGSAAKSALLSRLAAVLVKVLRWTHTDPQIRNLKPWLDEWEWDAKGAAETLRDLATDETVDGTNFELELRVLAGSLDEIAGFMHTFSSGAAFDEANRKLQEQAQAIFGQHISSVPFSTESQAGIRSFIVKSARKLEDSWRRAESSPFSSFVSEVQKQSGEIGRQLVEFSFYPVGGLEGDRGERLRELGQRLFTLEAHTMYHDGGESQRRAIREGQTCSVALAELAREWGT
jgi:ATP-dependent DNA helicase RecG